MFCHRMEQLIERYQKVSGTHIDPDQHDGRVYIIINLS